MGFTSISNVYIFCTDSLHIILTYILRTRIHFTFLTFGNIVPWRFVHDRVFEHPLVQVRVGLLDGGQETGLRRESQLLGPLVDNAQRIGAVAGGFGPKNLESKRDSLFICATD